MAQLAYQQIAITGLEATFAAATGGGDTVAPDDRGFIRVKNGGGSPITVTIVRPGSQFGQANPDIPVTVTNAEERDIGPLPRELADTDGLIDITYSGVTSVTVAALRL